VIDIEDDDEGDGCAFLEYLSPPPPRKGHSSKQGASTLPVSKPAALGGLPEFSGGGAAAAGDQEEGGVEEGEAEEEDGRYALTPLAEAAAAGDRYTVELLLEVGGLELLASI
jgi:hypothetical protein